MGQRTGRWAADDVLGLRQAMPGGALPALAAGVSFGVILAWTAALTLVEQAGTWQAQARPPAMVMVPQPGAPAAQAPGTRGEVVAASLAGVAGLNARRLPPTELGGLLAPWLSGDTSIPADLLPATFELRGEAPPWLAPQLARLAPGTQLEPAPQWLTGAGRVATRWQAVTWAGAGLTGGLAVCLLAAAARGALAGQHSAMGIIHGLGASEGLIASRWAGRVGRLSAGGALLGAALAVPVLIAVTWLVTPAAIGPGSQTDIWAVLRRYPILPWLLAACVPAASGACAWLTAQVTIRLWLRRPA